MTVARQYVAEDDTITTDGGAGEDQAGTVTSSPIMTSSDKQHADPASPNGTPNYSRLVMDEEQDDGRQVTDLREEVLLAITINQNHHEENTIEHETALAAVSRAKERRKLVIVMQKVSQILLYVLPTLIVICLILYWTLPEDQQWLTMMAAVLGVACVIDFIFFQYFTNRVEGTDLLNTVAKFRAQLKKSGRRF